VPALARKPEPDPVFVLAGGPGQSATDVGGLVFPLFAKINRERDIVFVDQRGTGGSNPLSCAEETASSNVGDMFDPATVDARVAACAKRLAAKADLTRYTTSIAMRDLDEVRARLGYERIDLWGGSYGTRAALEYARQFPQRVRSMTLDGVAPAWQKLPISLGVDAYATIGTMVGACAHDAGCSKQYPELAAQVDKLLDRLDGGDAQTTVANPVTGRRQTIRVTAGGLAALLRAPLYASLTASLLPAAVTQAAGGDFDALAALTYSLAGELDEHLALGMHLSVVCSEDMPAISSADLEAVRAEGLHSAFDGRPDRFAAIYLAQYRRLCAQWPSTTAPPAFFETLAGKPGAAIPTLLLSGGIDPATPPAHADEVARAMTHAAHLVAPNVGHGVSLQGCAPDLIEKFVKNADPKAIDGACLRAIPRPLFFVPLVEGRRNRETTAVP
jgi:pimeloyl-ACP methyl ester carboxylesterase